MIFIKGVDKNFSITKKLPPMESLKDTTTGLNIFESVMHFLEKLPLCLNKLVSITKDSVPALTGVYSGLIKQMNYKIQADHPLYKVLSFQYIIHRDFKNVADPIVQAVK